jgi:hypothetical protein
VSNNQVEERLWPQPLTCLETFLVVSLKDTIFEEINFTMKTQPPL